MTHLVLTAAAALCGLAVGLATHRLLNERAEEPGADDRSSAAVNANVDAMRRFGVQPRARVGRRAGGLPHAALLAHPLVLALGSMALAALPALSHPLALAQALLLLYLLYPLALVDLTTLTIEPALIVGGVILRMATVLALQPQLAVEMLGGLLAGAGLLALVGFTYTWLRGRDGLGEGDAAVLGLVGAFVGWQGILPVVLLATATGLVVGLPVLLAARKPLHTPLPFAPFLCAGGMAVYLAQAQGWRLFGLLPAL